MRKFSQKALVIATHNEGKLQEIKKLFENYRLTINSAAEFGLEEPKETENSFIGNARIKAHYASKKTGLPALSDDSGIEVESLQGAPGVYTADWAETENGRDFQFAMEKVWEKVQTTNYISPYAAQFCSTLVLAWPDGHDEVFTGIIKGTLVWPIQGNNGHGFDPMFKPHGYNLTFAQMNRWEKNRISHRGLAFTKMLKHCFMKYP